MSGFTESIVEEAALTVLGRLGWMVLHGPEIAVGTPAAAERSDPGYRDVILERRLRAALARLNPGLPAAAVDDAPRPVEQGGPCRPAPPRRDLTHASGAGVDRLPGACGRIQLLLDSDQVVVDGLAPRADGEVGIDFIEPFLEALLPACPGRPPPPEVEFVPGVRPERRQPTG